METKANYALIGAFTLAVIAAAFSFIFWLAGPSKAMARRTYEVVFSDSVAGLTRGAAVTFNGLRVGEISDLWLNPKNPRQVMARAEVDKTIPIKVDTKAKLEFMSLTGVGTLALSGGSLAAADLEAGEGEVYPTIRADPSQFQNLLEAAQRIMVRVNDITEKVDKLLDQNADALTDTVHNIDKFSGALAQNGDSIKAMVENLTKASSELADLLETLNTFINGSKDEAHRAIVDADDTLRAAHKLIDDLQVQLREIGPNLARFSGPGLKQYEALAVDARKTLEQANKLLLTIEKDPSQVIFGGKPALPEYKGR